MDYNPTPVESPSGDSDTPPPTVAPVGAIVDHGDCVRRMTELEETISMLRAANVTLQTEQIQGSDSRLADFWAQAQELADNANHCEVFDQIAEALGGPSRIKEWTVTVTMMVSVPIMYTVDCEEKSAEDAEEYARDYVRNMSATDLEDYASWYDADADTYGMTCEAEEA
jgi:hypothetical protein